MQRSTKMANSIKIMPAISTTAHFIFIFFYAYLLLQVDGAPPTPMCPICGELIEIEEGLIRRDALLKHINECEKPDEQSHENNQQLQKIKEKVRRRNTCEFDETNENQEMQQRNNKKARKLAEEDENQELQGIMEKFVDLAKNLDDQFEKNIKWHFPKLAVQMNGLCEQYCNLNKKIQPKLKKKVKQNPFLLKSGLKVMQIAKMKRDSKIIALTKQLKELKKQVTLLNQTQSNQLQKMELDKRLAKLHKESKPICNDLLRRACEMRERMILLKVRYRSNDPMLKFLEEIMLLTEGLYNMAVGVSNVVNTFIVDRKMKITINELEHHDLVFVQIMKQELDRIYQRIITVQQLLKEEFPKLEEREAHNPLIV